jgi:hypothetical protein
LERRRLDIFDELGSAIADTTSQARTRSGMCGVDVLCDYGTRDELETAGAVQVSAPDVGHHEHRSDSAPLARETWMTHSS